MYRTLEAIFHRPLILLLLLIVLPLVSVAVVYMIIPRTYQSTASLWALRRVEVIGATGPESDLNSTPAQTQATAIDELLQSRTFDLAIADDTNVASTLNLDSATLSNPELRSEVLVREIATHVVATPLGYNLLQITYANRNPFMAQRVVQSVIDNYGKQSQSFSTAEAQNLLQSYQTQLIKAKADANAAAAEESQYIRSHPSLKQSDLATDPQYQQLHAQTLQAQATLANLQSSITTINEEIVTQGTGAEGLYKVLDTPILNYTPVSRTKYYLIGGIIGLVVALLACSLLIVMQIRRDDTVHTAFELQKVTAFPVIMQFQRLQPGTTSLLPDRSNLRGTR